MTPTVGTLLGTPTARSRVRSCPRICVVRGHLVLLERDPLAVVREAQLAADNALIAKAQDFPQPIRSGIQRQCRSSGAGLRLEETCIALFHETGKERIGSRHARDGGQLQFLHQPVLQRTVGPFHATLGLDRIGAGDLDSQLIQSPAEMGCFMAGLCPWLRLCCLSADRGLDTGLAQPFGT